MNKKLLAQILVYGSIWGIIEATLGHFLHWLPALISGSILFPIATVILIKAYQSTNSKKALIYIALVAASIKAIDFLLPQISMFKVLNPMIGIVVEALVVVGVVTLVDTDNVKNIITGSVIASIGWRLVFATYMFIQGLVTSNVAPYVSNIKSASSFILLEGMITAVFVFGFLYLERKYVKKLNLTFTFKPALGLVLFTIALLLQFRY